MKLTRVWIVTKPTPHSTLADILFETDLGHGLDAQYRGGLDPDTIHGFYDFKRHAKMVAYKLLDYRDAEACRLAVAKTLKGE